MIFLYYDSVERNIWFGRFLLLKVEWLLFFLFIYFGEGDSSVIVFWWGCGVMVECNFEKNDLYDGYNKWLYKEGNVEFGIRVVEYFVGLVC